MQKQLNNNYFCFGSSKVTVLWHYANM